MFVKDRKGRVRGVNLYNEESHQTSFKLIAMQCIRLKPEQIESARRVISRNIKRIGFYKIHVFPTVSVSSKPSEVRMGKGKGAIKYHMCRVQAGQLLFTIRGVSSMLAESVFLKASKKLPIQTKFIPAIDVGSSINP